MTTNLSHKTTMIGYINYVHSYNPLKPIKRGYKIWMRADMDSYISKFSIYQGKNSDTVTMHNPPSCFGLGEQVVFSLTEDFFGKNHQVFFDNYLASVPVAEYLLTKKRFLLWNNQTDKKVFTQATGRYGNEPG